MRESQEYHSPLEDVVKKTSEAARHVGKVAFKLTSRAIENTAKKTGEVALHAGKQAFRPVRNAVEKAVVEISPEKKERLLKKLQEGDQNKLAAEREELRKYQAFKP